MRPASAKSSGEAGCGQAPGGRERQHRAGDDETEGSRDAHARIIRPRGEIYSTLRASTGSTDAARRAGR